ncbi:glycosyltransferase family 2 protein [Acaricomes phytoseiuli]|uniref:glycosyltransferase family 2 protein n=1 Tax=Acaricomes phytoseiuli TaxID=291968 RepID=UPI0005BC5DE4|nr:glycosyltransferase family 2 protein [Acaricomes phytoseiuli]MCW1249406.1 glycosyltransferase family 2 protein [Acaricomes phytoseiuli]
MSQSSKPDTLIIVPAWNEAEAIGNTIREILEIAPQYDVLVVDDGSHDGTPQIARNAGARVVVLPFNLGVGGAMRTGFNYALRHGYSSAIQVDADGQHDPRDIARVLGGLQEADISIGARFAGRGNYSARGPRRWAMIVLSKVISWVARTKLTDVTSGFRAANQRAMRQYMEHFPTEYLGDTIDSLVVAMKSGCKVVQVPVEMRQRQAGSPSHSPFKAMIYLARSGLVLCFALARKRSATYDEPAGIETPYRTEGLSS